MVMWFLIGCGVCAAGKLVMIGWLLNDIVNGRPPR